MDKTGIVLRVFFEDPFWIIWVEVYVDDRQMISRNVIPKEFNDQEVYHWIIQHYDHLRFCSTDNVVEKSIHKNPKRSIREIAKQMKQPCVSTKSQNAYKKAMQTFLIQQKKEHHQDVSSQKVERFEKKQQKKNLRLRFL